MLEKIRDRCVSSFNVESPIREIFYWNEILDGLHALIAVLFDLNIERIGGSRLVQLLSTLMNYF